MTNSAAIACQYKQLFEHPGLLLQAPRQVFCAWGLVLVIHADDSATCLTEKPLAKKVELLYNKNLYPVALSLARSEQVGLSAVMPRSTSPCLLAA